MIPLTPEQFLALSESVYLSVRRIGALGYRWVQHTSPACVTQPCGPGCHIIDREPAE